MTGANPATEGNSAISPGVSRRATPGAEGMRPALYEKRRVIVQSFQMECMYYKKFAPMFLTNNDCDHAKAYVLGTLKKRYGLVYTVHERVNNHFTHEYNLVFKLVD